MPVPDDATVTGDAETKTIPREAAFVGVDKSAKTGAHSHHDENAQPPVARNKVMNLEKNARGQGKGAAIGRHETGKLRHHEGNEDRDQDGAREREESRINQRLL